MKGIRMERGIQKEWRREKAGSGKKQSQKKGKKMKRECREWGKKERNCKWEKSTKKLGHEKDYAGEGQKHLQKTDPSSRQRGAPQRQDHNCQTVINIWS
jgi:hypothetical protein